MASSEEPKEQRDEAAKRALLARRGAIALVTLTAMATLGLAVPLMMGVPTVQAVPGWFWEMRDTRFLGFGLLAAVCLVFPYVLRYATRARHGWSLLAAALGVVALGYAAHHGLAFAHQRGIDMMRSRILLTGHAEFGYIAAVEQPSVLTVVSDYETFIDRERLRAFSKSKPPGQLLFYMATGALADLLLPEEEEPTFREVRHAVSPSHLRLANLAAVLWPLFGVLPVLPLVALGRRFLGEEYALWPALLYVVAAPVALIQLHLDQVVYPLLAVSFWALAARGAATDSKSSWALAGVVIWLAWFVSFSLLPLPLIGVAVAIAASDRETPGWWKHVGIGIGVAVGAFLALAAVFYVALDYNPLVGLARAINYHAQLKGWRPESRWPWAGMVLLETAYWLGPPMVVAFLGGALWVRPMKSSTIVALGTLLSVLLTAVLGKTHHEVARLWLFYVPALAFGAAALARRFPYGSPETRLTVLVGGTLFWTFAMKTMQDFY